MVYSQGHKVSQKSKEKQQQKQEKTGIVAHTINSALEVKARCQKFEAILKLHSKFKASLQHCLLKKGIENYGRSACDPSTQETEARG